MGLAAEASAGVKAAFTMGQNIVSLVGTAYIGVNGVTNAAVAEVYRNRNPDNLIKGIEDLLGHEFAEMFWTALGNLEGNTLKLLRGERLEDGIDLSTVLAGGLFVGKMDLDVVDVREKAKTIFAGMGINALWNLDSTYMVGSETQGGSCDNDQRGPSWLKICDPADMSKVGSPPMQIYQRLTICQVYYIYRLSFAWDDVPEFSQAMAPAGSLRYMNGTGGYHGITLQDAALASIRYYNQFGNARPGTSEVANPPDVNAFTLQNQVLDDSVSHMLDGIFTIPVCWNAGGEFISSDAIDDARNYPCMCGDKPIHHEDNTFRPDLDKTGQFLIASRIELLNDWRAYCNHNMDCIWGDMAVAFQDIWPTFIGDGFSPVDGYMAKQFTKCSNCKCHGKMGKVDGEMQYAYDTERPDC